MTIHECGIGVGAMGRVYLIPFGVGVYVSVFLVRAFQEMLLPFSVCVVCLAYAMWGSALTLLSGPVGLAIVRLFAQGAFL